MTNALIEKKEKLKTRIKSELELIHAVQEHLDSTPHKINPALISKIKEIKRRAHKYKKLANEYKKQEQDISWFFIWHPDQMSKKWAEKKGQIKRIDNAVLEHFHREFNHYNKKNRNKGKTLIELGLKQTQGQSCTGVAIAFPKNKEITISKYLRNILGEDFYPKKVKIMLAQKGEVNAITLVNSEHKKVFLDWNHDTDAYQKTVLSFKDPLNKDKTGKSAKKYLKNIYDGLIAYGYPDDHIINIWAEVK